MIILFLRQLIVSRAHARVIPDLIELVRVVSSNEDTVDIRILERDLSTDNVAGGMV